MAVYVSKELGTGAMLGPFDSPPFVSWCETHYILTQPKKDSTDRLVIMDLSWPQPMALSIYGATPKDMFLGRPKKMHL